MASIGRAVTNEGYDCTDVPRTCLAAASRNSKSLFDPRESADSQVANDRATIHDSCHRPIIDDRPYCSVACSGRDPCTDRTERIDGDDQAWSSHSWFYLLRYRNSFDGDLGPLVLWMGLPHFDAARFLWFVAAQKRNSPKGISIAFAALDSRWTRRVYVRLAVGLSIRNCANPAARSCAHGALVEDDHDELLDDFPRTDDGDPISLGLWIRDCLVSWTKGILHVCLPIWWRVRASR